MPKLYNTKAQQARELFQALERGPAGLDEGNLTRRDYNLWVSTWVLSQLTNLIPQLKGTEVYCCTSLRQADIAETQRNLKALKAGE